MPFNGIVAQPNTNQSFCHKFKNAVTVVIVYSLCVLASTYWYLYAEPFLKLRVSPLDWVFINCILNTHTPYNPFADSDLYDQPCDYETKQIILKHVCNHFLINVLPTTILMIFMFALIKVTSKVCTYFFEIWGM